MKPLEQLVWPLARLGDAVIALAVAARLARAGSVANPAAPAQLGDRELDTWLEAAGRLIGLELDPVVASRADAAELLSNSPPALLAHGGGVLAVVAARRGRLLLLDPAGGTCAVPLEHVSEQVLPGVDPELRARIERVLADAAIPADRRARAHQHMVGELVSGQMGARGWLLRLPPGAPLWRQARRARLAGPLVSLASAHLAQFAAYVLAWWVLGKGLLEGRLDRGWLAAWALLLLTILPLRMLTTWSQGVLTTGVGALLKRRLLRGSIRLEPDEVATEGVGRLLGRVIESEEVERLAFGGGLIGALAAMEILVAAVILGAGAAGLIHLPVLVAWLGGTLWLGRRLVNSQRAWTDERLRLTDETIERMVGHRTRLAQEHPSRWHDSEDAVLWSYQHRSVAFDGVNAALLVLVPRGWLIASMIALAPAFVSGADPADLAVSMGGLLLVWQSLGRLVDGITRIAGAVIAWRRVALTYGAAARGELLAAPDAVLSAGSGRGIAVETSGLEFRHAARDTPVLRGCDLVVRAGERVLIQGPSGGGKSTLAALLLGLRSQSAGNLMSAGLDRVTLGSEGWRRRIAGAPQFHENHVMSETFAFNLLMGRAWPPSPSDLSLARQVCHELGLGPLIERMPADMWQIVGDTGWQLSHGEKSRLFMARAILQDSEVVILDESFSNLDPESAIQAMECVRARARTLLVIAHP